MIEILILVSAVWALSARARQRGVNRTPFVVGALLGWFALWVVDCAVHFHSKPQRPMPPIAGLVEQLPFYLRWLCVGGLFFALEFARTDPRLEPWECPDCGEVNDGVALTCRCRRVRPDLRTCPSPRR